MLPALLVRLDAIFQKCVIEIMAHVQAIVELMLLLPVGIESYDHRLDVLAHRVHPRYTPIEQYMNLRRRSPKVESNTLLARYLISTFGLND